MTLSDTQLSLITQFGEMSRHWGLARSAGQIYALLMIAKSPVTANDIVTSLDISRGNVSMALKDLSRFHLIDTLHKPRDKKDYYKRKGTIWDFTRQIVKMRKEMELVPTLSLLEELSSEEDNTNDIVKDRQTQKTIAELSEALAWLTSWSDHLHDALPNEKSKGPPVSPN